MGIKFGIVGNRIGWDKDFVLRKISDILMDKKANATTTTIISGGARGVDKFAEEYAKELNIPIEIIRPINPANKLDYLFRNIEIITKADLIIAFWDEKSRGTKFVIDYAKARGKEVKIIMKTIDTREDK